MKEEKVAAARSLDSFQAMPDGDHACDCGIEASAREALMLSQRKTSPRGSRQRRHVHRWAAEAWSRRPRVVRTLLALDAGGTRPLNHPRPRPLELESPMPVCWHPAECVLPGPSSSDTDSPNPPRTRESTSKRSGRSQPRLLLMRAPRKRFSGHRHSAHRNPL